MRHIQIVAVAALAAVMLTTGAFALEIPVTVTERAGVDRVDNQVSGGIPLPEGAYKDVEKFGLYRADGTGEPAAQFVVRERWLKDDSVRFMTVHFKTDIKAGETAKFVVKDERPKVGQAPIPVSVAEAGDGVMVANGVIEFTVKKGDWHLFDSVTAAGKSALQGPGKVVFKAEYGKTPVEKLVAKPPALGQPADATAVVKSITVEEKGPGRAVVLVKGAFQAGGADKLDFQARYYAVANCAAVRVVFTVINRQGKSFDEFVGLRALGFELPLALDGDKKFALGGSDKDLDGDLGAGDKIAQLQPSSIEYLVSGKADAKGKCKEPNTNRVGWLSLAGKDRAVTAAVRWFWQLHPKGLEADGAGNLKVWLVPYQEKKVEVPATEYSEPLVRIDLYAGGARTHEVLFAFHGSGNAADARARAMSTVAPLLLTCSPEWYCQKTLAFDKMYDIRVENYRPEVRDLIKKYEFSVDGSFCNFMAYEDGKAKKEVKVAAYYPMPGSDKEKFYVSAQKVEEFGWMNWGSHCEFKGYCTENDALNTRWDGNYYDVPRACLVRFLRTGMWQYFDAGEAAALHLADIDICLHHPTDPKLDGIEHTCPNRGHFRQWWGSEPFGVSGNVDSAKSQSFFEFYVLTGDAWYREAGLQSGDYLVNHGGGALRAQGNRITGLFASWRSSRDEKYKAVWQQQAQATAKGGIATEGKRGWDQFWMYGLASEGLYNYFRATGDLEAAKGVCTSTDSLIFLDANKSMGGSKRGEYNSLAGFTLPVFGYSYELTGDAKYLTWGLDRLKITADQWHGRSKAFAQHARISPQFLYYLANDYQPPKPVLGDKQQADAPGAAIKAWAEKTPATAPGKKAD
ncbi:MAG: hypothetical protein PHU85_04960 [Phycisphaerae bacterium]|nr:hypothetical protein [Phycisphaerae bacterium]